jgi:predicted DNA binding CopG/RHH family protein
MPNSRDNVARRKTSGGNGVSSTALSIAEQLEKEVAERAVVPKMKKPKFASEEEEADWYPAHPEYLQALFEQAAEEGKLGHGTMARIFGLTKPVTIRLSQQDIAKARAQAKKKGVGYQTYMKILLHEALAHAEGSA